MKGQGQHILIYQMSVYLLSRTQMASRRRCLVAVSDWDPQRVAAVLEKGEFDILAPWHRLPGNVHSRQEVIGDVLRVQSQK